MHPQLAPLLSGLGSAYVAQRRYKEAGNVIGRALGILEKTVGPDHPDFAAALSNLASLDFYEHNYKRSIERNRRALAIDEARFGADHPLVAIYENNLASSLIMQHKYVEAEAALQHALSILDRPGLHEPQHLGDILINLGQICAATTREDEALRYYKRAI